MASEFLLGLKKSGVLEKVRGHGDILGYNPAINEFGVVAADGTIRTLFKPKNGLAYWNKQ